METREVHIPEGFDAQCAQICVDAHAALRKAVESSGCEPIPGLAWFMAKMLMGATIHPETHKASPMLMVSLLAMITDCSLLQAERLEQGLSIVVHAGAARDRSKES